MEDYIVGVDSSGQPYIEHWGQKKNHKYIARISDGKGGYRYFYTQAEWNAYVRLSQWRKNRANKKEEDASSKKLYQNTKKAVKTYKKNLKKARTQLKRSERGLQRTNSKLRKAKKSGNSVRIAKVQKKATNKNREILNASVKVRQTKKQYENSSKKLNSLKKRNGSTLISAIRK